MSWNTFPYFAIPSVLLWAIGAWAAFRGRKALTLTFTLLGILLFFAFIVGLWVALERPPLRTMGETRLWYSFFLPVAGIIVWLRWQYRWILSFSTLLALVFICVNLFKPEIHSTTLMPALQSPWFAPHVIVYMFCYALFGAATCIALFLLIAPAKVSRLSVLQASSSTTDSALGAVEGSTPGDTRHVALLTIDNLVDVGLSFMTFGMLFGALWAKEAWGTYWAWDPKETWAAITWLSYLVYVHYRRLPLTPLRCRVSLWTLVISFVCLQMCWWGINYLPSAQGKSIHTYSTK